MISHTKSLKIKSFLSFKYATATIYVAIRLAEDGTRWAGYSFDYLLVNYVSYVVHVNVNYVNNVLMLKI